MQKEIFPSLKYYVDLKMRAVSSASSNQLQQYYFPPVWEIREILFLPQYDLFQILLKVDNNLAVFVLLAVVQLEMF